MWYWWCGSSEENTPQPLMQRTVWTFYAICNHLFLQPKEDCPLTDWHWQTVSLLEHPEQLWFGKPVVSISKKCEKCAVPPYSPIARGRHWTQGCNWALWHLQWYLICCISEQPLLRSMQEQTLCTFYLPNIWPTITWTTLSVMLFSFFFSLSGWSTLTCEWPVYLCEGMCCIHKNDLWFSGSWEIAGLSDIRCQGHADYRMLGVISKTWTEASLLVSDCLSVSRFVHKYILENLFFLT